MNTLILAIPTYGDICSRQSCNNWKLADVNSLSWFRMDIIWKLYYKLMAPVVDALER